MLKSDKEVEEISKLSIKIKDLEVALMREEGNRRELETEVSILTNTRALFEHFVYWEL